MVNFGSLTLASILSLTLMDVCLGKPPPAITHKDLLITGPPAPNGGWTLQNTPERLEIRELAKDKRSMTLFMLALARMQDPYVSSPKTELDSYWRIAAIHGKPGNLQWGTAGVQEWVALNKRTGWNYCAHEHPLFPGWHRPYMVLFEQTIVKHALAIAEGYDGGEGEWSTAAAKLRLPYWDWAKPLGPDEPVVPEIATAKRVIYLDQWENEEDMENPLRLYVFPGSHQKRSDPLGGSTDSSGEDGPGQWDDYYVMERYNELGQKEHVPETERRDEYVAKLKSIRNLLSTSTYRLLTDEGQTYTSFSNSVAEREEGPMTPDRWAQQRYLSIESLHDQVHAAFGSSTQMGLTQEASYDPLFWLHHANVDRLYSLWLKKYPNLNYEQPVRDSGVPMPLDDGIMKPFFDGNNRLFTADGVKDTMQFGYVYRDVVDDHEYAATINMYRSETAESVIEEARGANTKRGEKDSEMSLAVNLSTRPSSAAVREKLDKIFVDKNKDTFIDYECQFKLSSDAFKTTTSFYVFLGSAPPDPAKWLDSQYFVGTYGVWTNNMKMGGEDIHGSVSLTNALMHLVAAPGFGLDNMKRDTVAAYLNKKLTIVATDGDTKKKIVLKDVTNLKIVVTGTEVTMGKDAAKRGNTEVVYSYRL